MLRKNEILITNIGNHSELLAALAAFDCRSWLLKFHSCAATNFVESMSFFVESMSFFNAIEEIEKGTYEPLDNLQTEVRNASW